VTLGSALRYLNYEVEVAPKVKMLSALSPRFITSSSNASPSTKRRRETDV